MLIQWTHCFNLTNCNFLLDLWSKKYIFQHALRKLSQQWRLLTLKHNTVLIMLFGLSVAPLHSDLWDLCGMLHANAAAAFKTSLFDSEYVVNWIHKSHICMQRRLFIHPFYPEADDNSLCACFGVGGRNSRSLWWLLPVLCSWMALLQVKGMVHTCQRLQRAANMHAHTHTHNSACLLVSRKPGSNFVNNYHWCSAT